MRISPPVVTTFTRILAVVLAVSLTACGSSINNLGNISAGENGVVGAITDGIFRDSNVSGVNFVSGSQSGLTDSTGGFTFINGDLISLSVGAVPLGSVAAQSFISPVNLIANGTTASPSVLNLSAFLMLLDNDGNPTNGIVISPTVQNLAKNWPPIDFTADLSTALAATNIQAELNSISGETHVLPDPTPGGPVEAHLEAQLGCTYSGAFGGQYTGPDGSGTDVIGLYIDPLTGNVGGFTVGTTNTAILPIAPGTPLAFNLSANPVVAFSTSEATYTFQFADIDDISGNWNTPQGANTGTFGISRGGTDQTPEYRFSGSYVRYDNTDAGVLAFGIDPITDPTNISLTGQAFEMTTATVTQVSGTLLAGQTGSLTLQTDDNKQFTANIDTIVTDAAFLKVSGTYTDNANPAAPTSVGTFTANGCVAY